MKFLELYPIEERRWVMVKNRFLVKKPRVQAPETIILVLKC